LRVSRHVKWNKVDGMLTDRARKAAQWETCRGLEERILGA
jgi:hypothetical protein